MSDAPVLLITDRLRGKYTLAVNDGAGPLNGSNTFTRQFETPPIQHEAAALIEELLTALKLARAICKDAFKDTAMEWDTDSMAGIDAAIAKAAPPNPEPASADDRSR